MKKRKPGKIFYFKEDTEEFIIRLNKKFPIKLKGNEDLINRISLKYPYIKKRAIIIIVTKTLETIRDCLIRGDIINVVKGFMGFEFHVYNQTYEGQTYPSLKARISTLPRFQND